jgi:preprotein translocase subunit SecA
MDSMLKRLGLEDGEAIVHSWINKALEKAQQKVEARNFEIRKQLLKYDDVMNDQRKVIYEQRKEIMRADDVHATVQDMRHETIEDVVGRTIPKGSYIEQWDLAALHEECRRLLGVDLPIEDWAKEEGIADQEITERITKASDGHMAAKVARYGREVMRMAEKSLLLQLLDQQWKDHLLSLDHLRQGINLRAYAQRDPLNEYKREAFAMFETMLEGVRANVTGVLSHIEVRNELSPEEMEARMAARQRELEMHETHAAPGGMDAAELAEGEEELRATGTDGAPMPRAAATNRPVVSRTSGVSIDPNDPETWGRVPRNSACPCGSGKKFKHCHGKL